MNVYMAVYVVMKGDYQGDWIEGAYSTLQAATRANPGEWELESHVPPVWWRRHADDGGRIYFLEVRH